VTPIRKSGHLPEPRRGASFGSCFEKKRRSNKIVSISHEKIGTYNLQPKGLGAPLTQCDVRTNHSSPHEPGPRRDSDHVEGRALGTPTHKSENGTERRLNIPSATSPSNKRKNPTIPTTTERLFAQREAQSAELGAPPTQRECAY